MNGNRRPCILGGMHRVACLLIALSCACASDPTAPADVIYEAGATDEAWTAIDAVAPTVDDALAPRLTGPTSPLARGAAAPTFSWTGAAVGDGSATRAPTRERWQRVVWRELFPVAYAHEPPVTGAMYRLIIDLPGAAPIRVLTGATSYVPSPDAWTRIQSATAPIGVELLGAYLQTGRLQEGPYVAATPTTIEIE